MRHIDVDYTEQTIGNVFLPRRDRFRSLRQPLYDTEGMDGLTLQRFPVNARDNRESHAILSPSAQKGPVFRKLYSLLWRQKLLKSPTSCEPSR